LDWLHVSGLKERVPLDIDRYPAGERAPGWEAVSAHFSAGANRMVTLLAAENGHIAGLGQVTRRDGGWHVARLLMDSNLAPDGKAVLSALLGALAQCAAERGAIRLHARVERHAPANDAFIRSGFSPYSHESVYVLPQPAANRRPATDIPIRPQESKDAWGIQQLYGAVTPHIVQVAEGIDATNWEIPSAAAMRAVRRVGERRWVLDVDGEIQGYMRTSRMSRRLQLILHPEAYHFAQQVVSLGISDLAPARAIRCCLPEYQGELGSYLEEDGFKFVGTQVVLLKQMTVAVRAESRVRRPVLEPTLGTVRTFADKNPDKDKAPVVRPGVA
jgi:hypothetical protein